MTLAFIPLRGGSKSIPLKNIKSFCGEPLAFWAVEVLEKSKEVDKIVIATESLEIKQALDKYNFQKVVFYDRDAENARDTSSTEDVILEYLKNSNISSAANFILVQATNPFITSEDITKGLSLFKEEKYDSLLTCVRYKRFFWNKDGSSKNYNYQNRPRRQDFEGDLMENGAFYISTVRDILKSRNRLNGRIGIYEMPEYSSYEIDEPDDWIIMENLFRRYILKRDDTERSIKLLLSDVDGVLTDAGMYYSENGDELKKFNTHDGMGIKLLREKGIKVGLVTSENTKIVENRAKKLKVDYLYQGKLHGGKLEAAKDICKKEGITLNEVAYIGDDINCLELLSEVGLAACPSDAVIKIRNIPNIMHLEKKGGEGALREFADYILETFVVNYSINS